MSQYVVDASATLAWLFGEEEHRRRLPEDWEQASMVAPWLWRTEVANVILIKERRGSFSVVDGTRFLHIVDALEVEIVGDPKQRTLESLAQIARPHQLTAYDTLYLELAIARGLPLCTFDRALQQAASTAGVPLVQREL